MKSFLTILSAMLMTFAVIGCGGGDTATDTADPAVDTAPGVEMPAETEKEAAEKPAAEGEEKPAAE